MFKKTLPKLIFQAVQRSPYAAAISATLLALGGVAAWAMRSPQTRARTRDLTHGVLRLLPGGRPSSAKVALAAANQPY